MLDAEAQDGLFGRLAVHRRFISMEQLAIAAAAQTKHGTKLGLAEVLVQLEFLTPEQRDQLEEQQRQVLERRLADERRVAEERARQAAVAEIQARPVDFSSGPQTALQRAQTLALSVEVVDEFRAALAQEKGLDVANPTMEPQLTPASMPLPPPAVPPPGAEPSWSEPSWSDVAFTAAGAAPLSPPPVTMVPLAPTPVPAAPPSMAPPSMAPTPVTLLTPATQSTQPPASPPGSRAGFPAPPKSGEAWTTSRRLDPTSEARSFVTAMLAAAVEQDASDLHIHAEEPVRMRRFGALVPVTAQALPAALTELAMRALLPPGAVQRLEQTGHADCALGLPGIGRFRVNVYRQLRGVDAVFRVLKSRPPTLAELSLPEGLARLTAYHQGIVLCTGPAACGKSSTMAALVHMINEERAEHVVTIEDPIEVLHPSIRCVVNQREAGRHTQSFARALRAALREDPDVIVIGEMRDRETAQLALTAAETGHLVFATLHTHSAVRTINRLIGEFPPAQQPAVRAMLAESLRAIVSQRLLPRKDGNGVVPAVEVLMATPAVQNLIRDSRVHQVRSAMQTGGGLGMQLLDTALADLVARGVVDAAEARRHAEDPRAIGGA